MPNFDSTGGDVRALYVGNFRLTGDFHGTKEDRASAAGADGVLAKCQRYRTSMGSMQNLHILGGERILVIPVNTSTLRFRSHPNSCWGRSALKSTFVYWLVVRTFEGNGACDEGYFPNQEGVGLDFSLLYC